MEIICRDATLYYEVKGCGEPILLLHGNGEDHTYFQHQIPFLLEQGFQVILMDMRGHGASTIGNTPLDFHLFASDVITLLDELNIKQVHVLGFSDGANTAMQLALSYPNYVKSLILNGGNLSTKGIRSVVQTFIVIGYVLLSFFAIFSKSCKKKKAVMGLMIHHPHIEPQMLSHLQMPTLVIAGKDDIVLREHTEMIANNIPNANLVILNPGDHSIAFKQPDAFNQAIATFLKGV